MQLDARTRAASIKFSGRNATFFDGSTGSRHMFACQRQK